MKPCRSLLTLAALAAAAPSFANSPLTNDFEARTMPCRWSIPTAPWVPVAATVHWHSATTCSTPHCSSSAFCNWQKITLTFQGTAQSMVFSSNGGNIAFDNIQITAVPEPETYAMLLAGWVAVGFMTRRRRD